MVHGGAARLEVLGVAQVVPAQAEVERMKTCSRCHRTFHDCAVRVCPHPAVNRVYGPNVCYYCCKHCKHCLDTTPGISCGYVDTRQKTQYNKISR